MYSKPTARRGQQQGVQRPVHAVTYIVASDQNLTQVAFKVAVNVLFCICHLSCLGGNSSSNKGDSQYTMRTAWAEAAGVLLFRHTWTFMYESTLMRKPLYSIPHLSFTAIILPVRPARNGFGFTIPWHTTHNASKGEHPCRACHPMHQLTEDMVCCDCETKLNWLWVAPFNCYYYYY